MRARTCFANCPDSPWSFYFYCGDLHQLAIQPRRGLLFLIQLSNFLWRTRLCLFGLGGGGCGDETHVSYGTGLFLAASWVDKTVRIFAAFSSDVYRPPWLFWEL